MRDLLDRLGCFVQIGIGVAMFVALDRWTDLPDWGAAIAAFVGSYVGMVLFAAAVGAVLDRTE